ncbi:FixH family protein [Kribbella sp. DT2]|uniref:FixH family protein n=1 Tax=Kribbella sp. DT2 TaxID=3393427 RepID=UPI003CE84E91
MNRRTLTGAVIAVVAGSAIFLVTRGPDQEVSTGGSEDYSVRIVRDGPSADPWTVEVADRAGKPVTVDQVTLDPSMPQMGHATEPVTATLEEPGRYRAEGVQLPMPGQWEITVRLRRGATHEEIVVPVQVTK